MNFRIESGAEASSSKSAAAAAAPLWGSAAVNITIQPQAFSIFEKPLGRNNTQISCICANNTDRGTMVQCEVGSSTYALSHDTACYQVAICNVWDAECYLVESGHRNSLSICVY